MLLGVFLICVALWAAVVGVVVGSPLTLPVVFVCGLTGAMMCLERASSDRVIAWLRRRRPYDWRRERVFG